MSVDPNRDPRRLADTGLPPASFADRVRAAVVQRREPVYEPRAQVSLALTGAEETGAGFEYPQHDDQRYPLAYPAREMQTVERFRRAARVTLDASGNGFADLGAVPDNQSWILERLTARIQGATLAGTPDSLTNGGSQNAPAVGTNVVTIAAPPAGTYKVTAVISLTGTAETQLNNLRIRNGSTVLETNIPTISGVAPYTVVFDRVTLDGTNNLNIGPVANATAGSVYTIELTAQMLSSVQIGGAGVVALYAGSPPPAPGGTFAPNDADLFAVIPTLASGVGQVDGNPYPITPGTPVVAAIIGGGAAAVAVVNLMYAIGVWDRSGSLGSFPGD